MTTTGMRFFNTAGPIKTDMHYHIPPLARVDADDLLLLVRQEKYFVLHAPRQTGKTSALLALCDLLNSGTVGEYRCVYVNVEAAQAAREDLETAMRAIFSELELGALETLDDESLAGLWQDALESAGPGGALRQVLARWAAADPRPLVLLIDEIDSLIGDTLLSVLRQLRAGYPERPRRFPQSVILCGVRDVRDYRIRSSAENAVIAGGSAFNIKAESLRLGDFCRDDVESLLAQHTAETGQTFTGEACAAIWELTQGQPWLVNALAYEACFRNKAGRDRSRKVTAEAVQDALEQLIRRRETHLDQLTDKLQEERVRRVVEPLLRGAESIPADDIQYVRDLGLVAQDRPVRIANPIYGEVIPRDLTWTTQEMSIHHDPAWYVDADGRLRLADLLAAFQEFFREHSEHCVERFQLQGSRTAVAAAGVSAAHRKQRRPHRARVRPGAQAHGPADSVAAARGGAAGSGDAEGGGRMQVAVPQPGADRVRGPGTDRRVHGSLRRRGGASRGLRPHPRNVVGRQDIPPRRHRREGDHRVGHVRGQHPRLQPAPTTAPRQPFDLDPVGLFHRVSQVPGRLQSAPRARSSAECLVEADRHFRRDP